MLSLRKSESTQIPTTHNIKVKTSPILFLILCFHKLPNSVQICI